MPMKDKILMINFKCKIKKKPEVSRESADESNCVHMWWCPVLFIVVVVVLIMIWITATIVCRHYMNGCNSLVKKLTREISLKLYFSTIS